MKKTTLIIIAAMACIAIAGGAILASGIGSHPRPEDATVSYLISVQKDPPGDYIGQLEQVIQKNKNQTVRDTAVNTLTDIAIRRGETERIIGFLKDLAANEKDPVIMSAAYAGIDLIRDAYPRIPMGFLNLSVTGNVRKGGEVTIAATVSSPQDIGTVVLGLDFPPGSVEMITPPVSYVNLTANTPKTETFRLRILTTGWMKIPVQLTVSTDRTEYEQIERAVFLDIRESGGEYIII